jgi:hypothetical protein
MPPPPSKPAPDPVLEARIQHALAPYVGRLTPAALADARRMLEVVLTTHPTLAPAMDRLRQATRDREAAGGEGGGGKRS